MDLKTWVDEWLTTKSIMVKQSTADSYRHYAKHIQCTTELTELTTQDIQRLINSMYLDGAALSTIKHMLTLCRQSLRKARALGMINNLAMLDNLELPRSRPPKDVQPLTRAQCRRIISNANNSYYGDFFTVLLLTGLRVGELIALRVCDVDVFCGLLHIRNTDYSGILQPVKTKSGRRHIPMSGAVKSIILSHVKRASGINDRVFKNTLGRCISYRTVLDSWHRLLIKCDIYNQIGLHVCRHTYAHMAIRAGVPVKVVSALLGHSDVGITLNIYDSVDPDDMIAAVDIVDDVLFRERSGGGAPCRTGGADVSGGLHAYGGQTYL